jgi:hypothetical protein
MTYEPSKILLKDQSAYIKKISKNYYLIKKNDSILSLAKMDNAQKTDFSKYIAKLKIKEEEELERRRAERNKGFDTGDYNAILFLPTALILLKILESLQRLLFQQYRNCKQRNIFI